MLEIFVYVEEYDGAGKDCKEKCAPFGQRVGPDAILKQ